VRVLLFDIDGTLLFSGGAGKRAMTMAFREVFGVDDGFAGISMSGKTDTQILREALAKWGRELDAGLAERFRRRYFEYLRVTMNDSTPGKRLVPGVSELLRELDRRTDALVGLLTGNWRESAYIKLAYFGLDGYFRFGAFADDSEDRNALVPFAIQRASELAGHPLSPEDTWVIGDTPRDVECGLAHGTRVLGVAASEYGEETLLAAGATHVVKDFRDPRRILSLLLS
jgi:phosphoglycolate phosphatase-like HAD superfamily hydrolase